MADINYFAVLVATLLGFGIGAAWYSPMIFGVYWMQAVGYDSKQGKMRSPAIIFGGSFVALLIVAVNLALFLGPQSTLATGTMYGFFAGFGWVAMAFLVNDLFENRPFQLYAINAGYQVVTFTVMGAVIGAWH